MTDPTTDELAEAVAAALRGEQTILRDSTGKIWLVIGTGKEAFDDDGEVDRLIQEALDKPAKPRLDGGSWFD